MDKTQISISGISSGAAMATQMHVIYSSHFMSVGLIAGGILNRHHISPISCF